VLVLACSFVTYLVTFPAEAEEAARVEFEEAMRERQRLAPDRKPILGGLPSLPEIADMIKPMALLRIFVGIALAVKGIYFISNMNALEELAGNLGQVETLVAWYVVAAHVVGGACLAVGLGTRVAAAVNIPVMLGATFLVHSSAGLFSADQGLQLSVLVAVTLALFVWAGSGKLSLDRLFKGHAGATA